MKSKYAVLGTLLLAFLLTGCATRTKMAFEEDADRFTDKNKPVFLMTTTIKNSYHPRFQPRVMVVYVERPDAKEAADRLNFVIDRKAKHDEDDSAERGNTYLLRLELEPGPYEIRGMSSLGRAFPVNGFFYTPLNSTLVSKDPGVYYLGHVRATVRERQGNEFRAGQVIPLIDQGIAGASGGTFDVEIIDRFNTDEALFRAKFPALADVKIIKAILPAFDRDKAQKRWEAQ